MSRGEFDGAAVGGECIAETAQRIERDAAVAVGVGKIRCQREGTVVVAQGFVVAVLPRHCEAEVAPDCGVGRLQGDQFSKRGFGGFPGAR